MSRQHNALVEGSAQVRLVCDVCEKVEWSKVIAITADDLCLEWEAVQGRSNTWQYADDALVCSEKCAAEIWQ